MNCSLKPSIESVRLGNIVDCALNISVFIGFPQFCECEISVLFRKELKHFSNTLSYISSPRNCPHHPADASSANTFGHSILFSTEILHHLYSSSFISIFDFRHHIGIDIVSVFRAFYSSSMHNHLNDSLFINDCIICIFDENNEINDEINDEIIFK